MAAEKAAFNIINPHAIEDYIKGFATDGESFDETLYDYLNLALSKALTKEEDHVRLVAELPSDAPSWLREKWSDATFYEFTPQPSLHTKISRVKDWIRGALQRGEGWIRRTDDRGRPLKLLKIGSLEQALKEAEKGSLPDSQEFFDAEILTGDIHTVMAFPDGYRFVHLLSEEALDRESKEMGHCIGQGTYDSSLTANNPGSMKAYYSLRDSQNKPHITLSLHVSQRLLMSCRGKENKAPVEKYVPYLEKFIRKSNLSIDRKWAGLTNLLWHEDKLYVLDRLPSDMILEGDLDLSGTGGLVFPRNLTITGDLRILMTHVPLLVPCMKIKGKLIQEYWNSFGEERVYYEREYRGFPGPLKFERWYKENSPSEKNLHRLNGPAVIEYSAGTGIPIIERWYLNGVQHREDGPAVICRDSITGRVTEGRWFEKGVPIQKTLN
ncbi:MAG: PcfJ domain-containing protein [Alphaproteobacteria bacterium]|nr:PcfJ domain-containing protein [Alphaproteobacteria bacterium]